MDNSHILIVEDEMIIARDLELILKKMGFYKIKIATSPHEAIEESKSFMPEIILMDINLGEKMDGIATVEEILLFLNTRVIYVTSHSNRSTLDKAMVTNPVNYIVKPFDEAQIRAAIRLALSDNHKQYGKLKNDDFESLSTNEKKVVYLISNNLTTQQIADKLFLSPKTIENYRYSICKKLELPAEKNSLIKWVYANKPRIEDQLSD